MTSIDPAGASKGSEQKRPPGTSRGYQGFRGTIGRTTSTSKPWWPPRPTPPHGTPNIVLVVADDMGFSDIGPYGSEIATPNLDRLAENGALLTNYHTTPLCSPSRASLLTGINPHRAGYGFVANADPGYPGMRLSLSDDVVALPEALKCAGYATFAIGKWHLVKDSDTAPGGPKDSWPLQRGFDQYYGSLEGFNSFFHPNQIYRDNSPVDIDEYPPDYYITDDLTDEALSMIQGLRAHDPDTPFFLYFAHTAMHGPLQAKTSDIDRNRGNYDDGWDKLRKQRFANQLLRGLFPAGTEPAGRNTEDGLDVPPWSDLTDDQRRRFAKYMEVYAAMVDSVDQSLGRLVDTLDALGELDNTIIVFTSDNGGSGEGGPEGTRSYLSQFVQSPVPPSWDRDVDSDESLIGSAQLGVHYPRGWGQVSNTPFRLYKGHTYAGGVRVPFVISWPRGLASPEAGKLRGQYAYVTDVAPTLLDLAGVAPPSHRMGLPAQPQDGVSIRLALDDPDVRSPHTEQYSEMLGSRGYYRDGWKLLSLHTFGTDVDHPRWKLFDMITDPCETTDVARNHPREVAELAEAWESAAWHNTVFPLPSDPSIYGQRRPDAPPPRAVRILPGTPTMDRYRSSRLVQYRDFRISVDLDHHAGDSGVLVAHGDQLGGYILYVEGGRLQFGHNAYGKLDRVSVAPILPGHHVVTIDAAASPDVTWNYFFAIDGENRANLPDQTQLVGMAPWTGISVGRDARGPVIWDLHQQHGTFRYTGQLHSLTYTPGEVRVPEPVIRRIEREADSTAD